MKQLGILGLTLCAAAFVACGGSDDNNNNNNNNNNNAGFKQPAGTVAVNFTVDDTANKVWKNAELEWKGSFSYDATTRIGAISSTWCGDSSAGNLPCVPLYDDGGWDVGGHEPKGSVAGDHKLGATMFVVPPASVKDDYSYGLRGAYDPNSWLWTGASNGSFSVAPGATGEINAPGQVLAANGNVDLRLTLTKSAVTTGFDTTGTIKVKGSMTGWKEIALYDDGTHGDKTPSDGVYTFLLSVNVDATKPPYPGLLKTGDKPEFVFVIAGTEYKVTSGSSKVCSKDGVNVYSKNGTAAEVDLTSNIQLKSAPGDLSDGNTYVTIP